MNDYSSIAKFSATLRTLPTVVAQKVAAAAAPVLTEQAKATFDASKDPYGVAWAPGSKGQTVKLEETGALKRTVYYVAIGTKLRIALGVPYAKYQIGKRSLFPAQGKPLPKEYSQALAKITADVVRAELGQ